MAAGALLRELRSAARHDEHEVGLAEALQQAEQQATALFLEAASKQGRPPIQPKGKDEDETLRPSPGTAVRRVSGAKVPDVVDEIRTAGIANPEAEFEITWRVVTE